MERKNKQNFLDLVPVRNPEISERCDGENVTLLITNTGFFFWLTQNLAGKPRVTQLHLDEIGSFLWPLMDGSRTVYELSRQLDDKFGQKVSPLYDRLIRYLQIMKQNDLISFR